MLLYVTHKIGLNSISEQPFIAKIRLENVKIEHTRRQRHEQKFNIIGFCVF